MLNEADEFTALHEGLVRLADRPGPPSSIDVAAARESGRRAVRIRQASWAGACVAVVTAGALCVALLPSASHGSGTAPGASGTPAASFPGRTVTPAPLEMQGDPVTTHLVLGDVPPGYQLTGDWESNDLMTVGYQGRLSAESAGSNTISLWVGARASDLPDSLGITGDSTYVQVNGRSGQLVTLGQGPEETGAVLAQLTWQDRAGRDYILTDLFAPGVDVRAQMLALADSVTVSTQPVPQPFYFSNLPSGLGYLSAEGTPVSTAQFGPTSYKIDFGYGAKTTVTFALTAPSDLSALGGPTAGNASQCENASDGWQLCVEVTGPMPSDIAAQGGTAGLLSDATALDPEQPQTFTTHVIR